MQKKKTKGDRPSKEQKDEQVLAAILAAAEQLHKEQPDKIVMPHSDHDGAPGGHNLFGVDGYGPCCAVGGGLIYSGLSLENRMVGAVSLFAEAYKVSRAYAGGVSDGFEHPLSSVPCSYLKNPKGDADYLRGFYVGRTAFEILFNKGANEP